jgi:integrase
MLDRDVLPRWRGRDARTIKPHEVIELLDGIVDRGSPVQANRVAGVLAQLFKFGIHRAIVEASPVLLLYRPGGDEKPRERKLSEDELRILVRDPRAGARLHRTAHAIMVLLATGQRRGELIAAKWADIDFKARTWRIPDENSKTGRGHVVPLSALAVRELEALSRLANRSAFVMPDAEGSAPLDAKQLTRSLAKCQKRFKEIGIEPFTLHDLRRTCRTGLAQLKVAPHIAERVLNHAQAKIPGTYDVHDYLDEKREALDKWGAHLEALRQ